MTVLIVIGLLHMYAIWAGDILTLYGLMGLLLPTLARGSNRVRLALIMLCLVIPFATHVVVYITDGGLDPKPPFAKMGAQVQNRLGGNNQSTLDLFANSGPRGYTAWNIGYAVARPGGYLQSGRPAHVLGLFLIGAWIGVVVLPRLASFDRSLRITALVGAAVGLPVSLAYAMIKLRVVPLEFLSGAGLLQSAVYAVGTTPLALSYLSLAVLAWRTETGQRLLRWFVPLGRMALTAYVTQSILQVILFTGWAFGLAGHAPIALLPVTAVAIIVMQRQACVWWLARYAQGPLEWAWRKGTYG